MKQLLRNLFFLSLCYLATCSVAVADILSVSASADSKVDALQPANAFPLGDLVAAKEGAPEAVATQLTFFYTQFDLPASLTGQGIDTLNSAQLRLARTGPNFSLTYHVYGVLDGLDTGSADGYKWNDGVGFDPTHNLVKFLSVDEISYYSDPAKSAFVGTIDTGVAGAGPFDFTSIAQSPTAAANLKNLILNDTDGRLTFYVGVRQNFGVTALNTFASLENGNFPAPTLVLDYTPVPEPGTLLLSVMGLAALFVRFNRKRSSH
jgi:PEP-CTERM motif